ncbi:phenylalanine--tRNA ligase subunit beta [Candidatus Kaiserbacteria bacterium]|nr:phenylalanine--tRNA ligase subunit beta [Candidatus Kaiserbacteria bacterium]
MKISREWLQAYFEKPLPAAQELADALTFHAFEIEIVEGEVLDVKVTPNRGHDCLSYRGIAKELSAILNLPLVPHPYGITDVSLEPKTDSLKVMIENPQLCPRFTAAYITGVKVGDSPEWLRTALESIGQKSINNIVDATNYVMFNIGQPLHAFDAAKLTEKEGVRALDVRMAKNEEKMLGLDDKEYALASSMLVIADGNTGEAVSIAGIKGGKPTGIDEVTTAIVLEAANWDGVTIRKTSQALKLRTDASDRFQQVISPELTVYGLKAAADLIVKLAGGEVAGYVDEYPAPQKKWTVSVSLKKINTVLGTKLAESDVADAFKRLDLPYQYNEMSSHCMFTVTPPFERLDLVIPEDLIEEVARIVGYDKIPATELSAFPQKPEVNANFYASERARAELTSKGYSEVFTSVFADKGERLVANKVDGVRPYLRANLTDGLGSALEKNIRNKDLLQLYKVKLFEIGSVWNNKKEMTMVGTVEEGGTVSEEPLEAAAASAYDDLPLSTTERYQPFSKYPFIVRDIAMWVPAETKPKDVLSVIRAEAGELLTRSEKFDEFKKGGKLSLAFRLVFQSFEKTLTDTEVNVVMEKVYAAVKGKGWEVR